MPHFNRFVGIDVSKDRLDIHCLPDGRSFTAANTTQGIANLLAEFDGRNIAFGCEATGGYEDLLLVCLAQAGMASYCLHPVDIRALCRFKGKRAKTDALDAKAIAEALIIAVASRKPVVRSENQSRVKELNTLRRTLLVTLSELKSLKTRMRDSVAARSIDELIDTNTRTVRQVEAAIARIIRDDPQLQSKARRITSAPGAGPVLAAELIASMPELGALSSKQAASLVGVAPHPRRSGNSQRNGRCQGGRSNLRRILYMAALSVIAPAQPFHCFYDRLRSSGKPFKVAIVAVMRKLIVTLNAMVKTRTDWNPNIAC